MARKKRYINRKSIIVYLDASEKQLADLWDINLTNLIRNALHKEFESKLENNAINIQPSIDLFISMKSKQKEQIDEQIMQAQAIKKKVIPNKGVHHCYPAIVSSPQIDVRSILHEVLDEEEIKNYIETFKKLMENNKDFSRLNQAIINDIIKTKPDLKQELGYLARNEYAFYNALLPINE